MNVASILPLADTWMDGDWGWGWMVVMMIGMVALWGSIIFGIVWLVRGGFDRRHERQVESAADVLDRRFAEGAITAEDYRERREVLVGKSNPGANGRHTGEPLTAAGLRDGRQL